MFAIFFNIECNQPSPHLRHHVSEAGGEDDAAPVAGEVGEGGPGAESGREATETGGEETCQQRAATQHHQAHDLEPTLLHI